MNSLFVSELTTIQKLEILIDTLKHGTSSLINSNLKIETSCRCGKFSGNKPLQYKIFFEFSLNQFIDPLPDYYSEFVFFKGLCAKVNTSVLFPKQNTFIQAFLGQNSKNFRQNSHFQSFCSCGKLNSIDFVAKNYPDLLVFWVKRDEKESNLFFNIVQLLISISGSFKTSKNSVQYGLKGIITNYFDSFSFISYDKNHQWHKLKGVNTHKIGKGTWRDVILNCLYCQEFPECILFEKNAEINTFLNEKDVVYLEKNIYFCILYNLKFMPTCQYYKWLLKNHESEEYYAKVECINCFHIRIEGIPCENCGFNEGHWNCKNGHDNLHCCFNCDYCNEYRCLKLPENFLCNYCRKSSKNTFGCYYCPKKICSMCDKILSPGNSAYCTNHEKYHMAMKNLPCPIVCRKCSEPFSIFLKH